MIDFTCPVCGKQLIMGMALGNFVWQCMEHGCPSIPTTTTATKIGLSNDKNTRL